MEFIILTGMSGSGKSSAADALEDLGYLCIDNMPVAFIPRFAEMYNQTPNKNAKVAFVIDVRGEIEFETLIDELNILKSNNYSVTTVFIDCDTGVIINRYKETRRLHPLVAINNCGIKEAIKSEREMLAPISEYADYTVDTTNLSIKQLYDKITAILSKNSVKDILINCMSFGFKHGIAEEADLVFDVRCFKNPYYVEELRSKTGLEFDVKEYVFSDPGVGLFLDKLYGLLELLIPRYIDEGKSQLTIAFGCTGGKHRSVAIAEKMKEHLMQHYKTVCLHRDIQN